MYGLNNVITNSTKVVVPADNRITPTRKCRFKSESFIDLHSNAQLSTFNSKCLELTNGGLTNSNGVQTWATNDPNQIWPVNLRCL